MTKEIALHCMKSYSELHSDLCELCPIYGQTGSDHCFEDALQYVIGMLEQEPTSKNDLAVDCISRAEAISLLTQVNKILVNSNSWLENTHESLNMAFDMAIKALEQEPKSEWEQDHAILKAYSDGANEVLDKIRAEIAELSHYYPMGHDYQIAITRCIAVIDKYKDRK